MEQHHFKVGFSVGTKLLLSVFLLLAVAIVFLIVSAIFILKEDKRAYTYQSQSTQSLLAGREFVNTAKHQLDTLRIALGAVDPLSPIPPQRRAALDSLVANQSDLLGISLGSLNRETAEFKVVARGAQSKSLEQLGFSAKDLEPEIEKLKQVLPDLLRNSYAFINLSRLNGTPGLGVLVADSKLANNPTGIPVAFGLASLKDFGGQLGNLSLTIVTRSGWVLFDTDPAVLFSGNNLAEDPFFRVASASRLSTGAQEYDVDGKHYISSYVSPGLELLAFAKTDWKKAIRATYELLIKFGLLGFMTIGLGLVFSILFSKTLTRPIQRLYEATQQIARGDFGLNIAIRSRDEIGALTGSFNVMSKQISELMRSQAEKIHLENELAIASTVQQTLIPPSVFENEDVRIFSHYQSASQCGGDWWGFFGVGKKLCFMIADATGHGMPSALITASARSCVSVMHKLAQEDPNFSFSPASMLSYANRVIYDASMGKIMMTFFIGVMDLETMTLSYASAGHNPPWLFQKQPDQSYKLQSLTVFGSERLGEQRDAAAFEEKKTNLAPGDLMFMYTDGLIEGKNPGGEMYGKKRTRQKVESLLSQGPQRVSEDLITDFLAHNQSKPLDDDVTIAVVEILNNPANGKKAT